MKTMAEIYAEYQRGSEGFCAAVESHCHGELLREEIERIASKAETPEQFDYIWQNEGWWQERKNDLRIYYEERVGYDPFEDDPTITVEQVRQLLAEYEKEARG